MRFYLQISKYFDSLGEGLRPTSDIVDLHGHQIRFLMIFNVFVLHDFCFSFFFNNFRQNSLVYLSRTFSQITLISQ